MGRFGLLDEMVGRGIRQKTRENKDDIQEGAPTLGKIVDYIGRPNAAIKSGIDAYQHDKPVMGAMYKGFTSPSNEAPTGHQLAETFSEQAGVESPAVLAGLATLAEMADIPGLGMIGKAGKLKNIGKVMGIADDVPIKKIPGFSKTGDSAAEALKKAKHSPFGKVAQTADKPQPMMKTQSIRDNLGDEKWRRLSEMYPHLKDARVKID